MTKSELTNLADSCSDSDQHFASDLLFGTNSDKPRNKKDKRINRVVNFLKEKRFKEPSHIFVADKNGIEP